MSESYSSIDTYGKCPKLYHYKYVLDLQPKKQASNLFRGITAHDMLKDWFLTQRELGGITVSPEQFVARWLTDYWLDAQTLPVFEDELFDHQKEVEQVATYVRRFLELGVWDEWTVLHVEEEFEVEIGGYLISFTPDLVLRDPDGFVWAIDHKTTGKFLDREALNIRPQALLYYTGLKAFYPDVAGFIFNYIRKKVPTVPRLNKTGKKAVNDLNRIDTSYEILRDFIMENDLQDDEAHRRRLAELRDKQTFFFQHPFYITDDMIEENLKDLTDRLKLMESELYPRTIREGYMGCDGCGFKPLCFTELTGGNTEVVLQWYEPREEKNPYEREEDDD